MKREAKRKREIDGDGRERVRECSRFTFGSRIKNQLLIT